MSAFSGPGTDVISMRVAPDLRAFWKSSRKMVSGMASWNRVTALDAGVVDGSLDGLVHAGVPVFCWPALLWAGMLQADSGVRIKTCTLCRLAAVRAGGSARVIGPSAVADAPCGDDVVAGRRVGIMDDGFAVGTAAGAVFRAAAATNRVCRVRRCCSGSLAGLPGARVAIDLLPVCARAE